VVTVHLDELLDDLIAEVSRLKIAHAAVMEIARAIYGEAAFSYDDLVLSVKACIDRANQRDLEQQR
jgi:hypothetical protein